MFPETRFLDSAGWPAKRKRSRMFPAPSSGRRITAREKSIDSLPLRQHIAYCTYSTPAYTNQCLLTDFRPGFRLCDSSTVFWVSISCLAFFNYRNHLRKVSKYYFVYAWCRLPIKEMIDWIYDTIVRKLCINSSTISLAAVHIRSNEIYIYINCQFNIKSSVFSFYEYLRC